MFRNFEKAWVLYLVTSYTVFTLPPPVFSQNNIPVPVQSGSNNNNAGAHNNANNVVDPSEGGAEPVQSASFFNIQHIDSVIAEASSFRDRNPPRQLVHPEPHHPPPPRRSNKRPPRRHPPPPHKRKPPHHKKPRLPPPPRRHLDSKPRKSVPVPKPYYSRDDDRHYENKRQQHHDDHRGDSDSTELDRERRMSHREKSSRDKHERDLDKHARDMDRLEIREKQLRNRIQDVLAASAKIRVPTSWGKYKMIESKGKNKHTKRKREPPSTDLDINRSLPVDDDYYVVALPQLDQYHYSGERSPRSSREISALHLQNAIGGAAVGGGGGPHSYEVEQQPLPWPKPSKPVQLSYFYDSDDGKDLKDLVQNHHLRRQKECDGLENFVYDLEIIAFLLGLIAAGFGFYADVIPFFNEGIKISYNNELAGDGIDFPHSYWPIKGDTHATVHRHKRSLIKIGDLDDSQREVLSVTGEFIGVAGLIVGFFALFPSLIEKFFFSLDWWFGKRGLWKQYLYTYKCEVHPYTKKGWGR